MISQKSDNGEGSAVGEDAPPQPEATLAGFESLERLLEVMHRCCKGLQIGHSEDLHAFHIACTGF